MEVYPGYHVTRSEYYDEEGLSAWRIYFPENFIDTEIGEVLKGMLDDDLTHKEIAHKYRLTIRCWHGITEYGGGSIAEYSHSGYVPRKLIAFEWIQNPNYGEGSFDTAVASDVDYPETDLA